MAKQQTMTPLREKMQTMDVKAPLPDVHHVALEIFVKSYMDTAGKTIEHLAGKSYEAAEVFCEVARNRTV